MADQHRRHFEHDRRDFGRERERSWQEPFHVDDDRWRQPASERREEPSWSHRPASGGDADGGGGYRYGNDGGYYPAPPRDSRQSGRDGQYSGGWTDDAPRRDDRHAGHYPGSQYRGATSTGRGYQDAEFHPHHVDADSRYRPDPRYRGASGPSSEWRDREVGHDREGLRSARSSGQADWSTGGAYGGNTSFEPMWNRPGYGGPGGQRTESYAGRGPKNYRRSDDRIRDDASDRLQDDPGVDASDITVQVLDGEVTLTGTVMSRDQKRRAEDCVEQVSGVREVSNQLRVNRGVQTASDGQSDDNLFEMTGKLKEESRAKP